LEAIRRVLGSVVRHDDNVDADGLKAPIG